MELSANKIPFTMRHLPISIIILFVYGIVNMAYTFGTGEPMYPVLTWTDLWSYLYAGLLLALEVFNYWWLLKL